MSKTAYIQLKSYCLYPYLDLEQFYLHIDKG